MRSRGEREIERKRKVGVEGGLKRELRKVSVGCLQLIGCTKWWG